MKYLIKTLWFLALGCVLLAAGRLIFSKFFSKPIPVYGAVPAFSFTESSGRPLSAEDLKGKVWIADFVFTRCAGICPLMSGHMKTLQNRFQDADGVRFVSFSVDPEHDTPEILKKYGERFGANPEKWFFLTGDKNEIFALSQKAFYLGVSDIPEAERPDPTQSVMHSSKFVLIDKQGRVRGHYNTEDPDFLGPLSRDARALLKGK